MVAPAAGHTFPDVGDGHAGLETAPTPASSTGVHGTAWEGMGASAFALRPSFRRFLRKCIRCFHLELSRENESNRAVRQVALVRFRSGFRSAGRLRKWSESFDMSDGVEFGRPVNGAAGQRWRA